MRRNEIKKECSSPPPMVTTPSSINNQHLNPVPAPIFGAATRLPSQPQLILGQPREMTPTKDKVPVHIDVGGHAYTSSLETLTKYVDSRLGKMFYGLIPIMLDKRNNNYFIDRDGRLFRYVLNFLRSEELLLPDNFDELEQLLDECQYYDITPLTKAVKELKTRKQRRALNGIPNLNNDSSRARTFFPKDQVGQKHECATVTVTPDLGERVCLTAPKALINELFPDLTTVVSDHPGVFWNRHEDCVVGFPLNGYSPLTSVQVIEKFLNSGFQIMSGTGGGVEGQQFSMYLFSRTI